MRRRRDQLIALLFEFILNDRAVPDAFKALIGRLQIPMLKSLCSTSF